MYPLQSSASCKCLCAAQMINDADAVSLSFCHVFELPQKCPCVHQQQKKHTQCLALNKQFWCDGVIQTAGSSVSVCERKQKLVRTFELHTAAVLTVVA